MLPKLPPGTPEVYLDTIGHRDHTAGYLTVKRYGVQLWRGCSLELPWRDNENGTSCFPVGDYPLILEHSPAFNGDRWELKNVPGRSECKIHEANFVAQLRGCVATGFSFKDLNRDGIIDVVNSSAALKEFHAAMGTARVSIIHVTAMMGQRVLEAGMNGWV